jgi:UDP-2,3-diacylglucosamine hydrolase
MKIATISDIHLTNNDLESIAIWESFVHSPYVAESTHVFLLGDIFDLMIGEKKEYLQHYAFFFDSIKYLILAGKKIVYLEGNHDFHLENTFDFFLKKNLLNKNLFEYKKDEFKINIGERTFLFCHGDIVDHDNEGFKKWKKIYRSSPFKVLLNRVLPFSAISYLGRKASNDSKKRNKKEFNYDKAKDKYRKGAEYILDSYTDVDVIIAGHTHVKDFYKLKTGKEYLNNGFPKIHKTFIAINQNSATLMKID